MGRGRWGPDPVFGDAAGNVKSRTDDSDLDAGLAGTTSYDYDPLHRLTVLNSRARV